MQSIANLVHDDPYLKMPKQVRIAERRRRRRLFQAGAVPTPLAMAVKHCPVVAAPADLAPMSEKDFLAEWVERQRAIPVPVPIVPDRFGKIYVSDIQRAVAAHFEMPVNIMTMAARHGRVVLPRQIAMYLAKTMTGFSLAEIGRRFGGRDHTTALSAIRKIQRMMETDSLFQAGVERLRLAIVEGCA